MVAPARTDGRAGALPLAAEIARREATSATGFGDRALSLADLEPIPGVRGLDVEDVAAGEAQHSAHGRRHVLVEAVRELDHDDRATTRRSHEPADDGTSTIAELPQHDLHDAQRSIARTVVHPSTRTPPGCTIHRGIPSRVRDERGRRCHDHAGFAHVRANGAASGALRARSGEARAASAASRRTVADHFNSRAQRKPSMPFAFVSRTAPSAAPASVKVEPGLSKSAFPPPT